MLSFNDAKARLHELDDIADALSIIHWDRETMMPRGAAESRGRQLATLSALHHRLATDKDLGAALRRYAEDGAGLSPDEQAMAREALWDYDRATKLPEDFVREEAELESKAHFAWVDARKADDYSLFRPLLAKLLDMARRKADLYGYEGSPYNGLFSNYERGMSTEAIRPMFALLAERQKDLIRRIVESPVQPDLAFLDGEWPIDAQEDFSRFVLGQMGFDFDHGRLDVAAHPFCTSFGVDDVRLTSRYDKSDLFSALFSAMHEGGHGLYERGLDPEWARTPLGRACSLGIHESQSRLWENMVGRSLPFWRRNLPELRKRFPGRLDAVGLEEFHFAINAVRPSLIRVEADECTYNLHIIIRFELEVAMVEGRLAVDDVPEAWNAKYKEYLGVDVPSDADGCLQDIHWSMGGMGYFSTYTLGNVYAAQIFEAVRRAIPDLDAQVEAGEMSALREWLRANIHMKGRRHLAPALVEEATGAAPSPEPYLRYLEDKFGALYQLKG